MLHLETLEELVGADGRTTAEVLVDVLPGFPLDRITRTFDLMEIAEDEIAAA